MCVSKSYQSNGTVFSMEGEISSFYHASKLLNVSVSFVCVCVFSVATGAPTPFVHMPAAPVHSSASHGSTLCGRAQ